MTSTPFKRAASALLCASSLGLSALSAQAATLTIGEIDFDGVNTLAPGVVGNIGGPIAFQAALGGPYNGLNGKSWAGQHVTVFNTDVFTMTVSNLPTHSQISIDFLLGFLNSWDSTDGSPAPDELSISIDGGAPVKLTTVTAGGSVNFYAGGTRLVDNGQIDELQFFTDDLVDMSTAGFLTFAHTASTLTMTIQAGGAGWQGGTDEYWGLDALKITATVPGTNVPEPDALALLAAALLAAAWVRRGRQGR